MPSQLPDQLVNRTRYGLGPTRAGNVGLWTTKLQIIVNIPNHLFDIVIYT
jgi:hypothetical protein